MITSTYGLTATERVLPRLVLDFTTAVADPRVVTARAANTATRFNQNGLIEIVNANLPRFDFSPTALTCQGQLIEETRTNLFLNSLIDGTNLSTQIVTLSAAAYTLSFYGSGSITISGGHSATVTGIGDFPNRKTYSFTPTAGISTFTVSGDVKFAQIEAGAFATSFIPTTTTSLTRNADVVSMTGTNFSDWYNASEGTFVADVIQSPASGLVVALDAAADASNRISLIKAATSGYANFFVFTAASPEANITNSNVIGTGKIAGAYKANNCALSSNGVAAITDTSVVLPTPTFLRIGARQDGGNAWNAPIKRVLYYPQRLTNAEVQAFSK